MIVNAACSKATFHHRVLQLPRGEPVLAPQQFRQLGKIGRHPRRASSLVARLLAEWRCRLAVRLKHLNFGAGLQARELRDIPRLEAFCRVAPVVRFSVRAMLAVRVFFFASVFNVRTSDAVHSRRFVFLAI